MSIGSFLHEFSNPIGMVGVVLVLVAYLLLQLNKMSVQDIMYSLLNTVGSVLILVSLYYHLNLAAAVIEVAWLIISIYGLVKAIRIRAH